MSGVAKAAFKLRAEIAERYFAHVLDRGGMRWIWPRGRDNVDKRYLLHLAGHNLGLLMRALIGAATPKEAIARGEIALEQFLTCCNRLGFPNAVISEGRVPGRGEDQTYLPASQQTPYRVCTFRSCRWNHPLL